MSALNAPGRFLQIDGQQVQVKFTTNRMITLEEKFGSLDAAGEALQAGVGKALRYLLWMGTGSEATCTEEEFGEKAIAGGLVPALTLVVEAFHEAMGTSPEDVGPAAPVDPTTEVAPSPSATS